MIERLRDALARMEQRHRNELADLVRLPTESASARGLADGAAAVAELLRARGMRATIHATPGAPVVTAEGGASAGPTVLFYSHYDVQPAQPLDKWTVPPFELTERDGCLFGRGSADTKANFICRLAAIDALREVLGSDPVRYLFLVEGEEEIGSVHLPEFIRAHAGELRADACIWETGGVDEHGRPGVFAGMKGIVAFDLTCRVAARDLHSSLGAVVDNPLWRIASAVASLRDADGRATIDGFYDDVDEPSDADLEALRAQPDTSALAASQFGVEGFLGGAAGVEYLRRAQLDPVVNVNGIAGGYSGPGVKTVLPAEASAKLDIRLVPSQDPDRVLQRVRDHLDARGLSDVRVTKLAGEGPGRTPIDDPFVRIVVATAERAHGKPAVVRPSVGGSGPVHAFRQYLGVPFASSGCSYPGSRQHAPDEHIRIGDFAAAKLHTALILAAVGGHPIEGG